MKGSCTETLTQIATSRKRRSSETQGVQLFTSTATGRKWFMCVCLFSSIYEKLIQYCSIDELGTNYPKDMFDPHGWSEDSYYEALGKTV